MKGYPIFWSPLAEETYLKTLTWILDKWTLREAINFENKVNGLIEKLKIQKKLCPVSSTKNSLRRCVITPQTSLVYQIKNKIIEIVVFIDNRSDHKY
ncbi:MAG: hypothetical protein DRH21_04480 [Deltaproteobacteria bacterium]|nr:MAG: hypothetical protein DRH21_04480 [Deltaproteobacteria bacterium]